MKIFIYGAGVIGSIFAGKLALSKNNVTVLARDARFDEIKKNGIILVNPKTRRISVDEQIRSDIETLAIEENDIVRFEIKEMSQGNPLIVSIQKVD